jgi:hypothetical protein
LEPCKTNLRRYYGGRKTNVLEPCEEGEGRNKKIDLNYKRMWNLINKKKRYDTRKTQKKL